jgi:hypothetical protein
LEGMECFFVRCKNAKTGFMFFLYRGYLNAHTLHVDRVDLCRDLVSNAGS